MYIKLLVSGICFVLSLFNILGAMQQIPVKTTVGDSSRPAVAMMKPPGANLNWLSGGVFFAASITLIAWAIREYNSSIEVGIDSEIEDVAPVRDFQKINYPKIRRIIIMIRSKGGGADGTPPYS